LHRSSSLPDQHLVSWVTEGRNGTVADTIVAVAGGCEPTPKLWNPSQYIAPTMIEDTREHTKLLAVCKHLGHVAGDRASAYAGGLVTEDRPWDRGVAGELGGGVAVSVLHPCRDGSVASDAGAIDKHVLDLPADGKGALLELSAAAGLDWRRGC
jgi:hypothetical protein